MRLLLIVLSIIFLESCSSSYKQLNNDNHQPKDSFSKYLLDSYKAKADFEAKEMHDWNSAKLYSEKALAAIEGKKIKPQKIKYWKIPKEKINELEISYNNLMTIYNDAMIKDPYNLAIAISSLDCWSEQQEENWQIWDINKCKEDFLQSMHKIYNKIKPKEDKIVKNVDKEKSDSVSVITSNDNKEILQLIYFDFDKSIISDVGLKEINLFIKNNKNKINKFLIVGHADTKGTKEYNYQLSLERALSVKNILQDLGIEEQMIKILGKGENELLIQTSDEIAHPANRRAEISPLN